MHAFDLIVTLTGGLASALVFGYLTRTRSRELFTLTVLVIALGIAVGSATVFHVSMALGVSRRSRGGPIRLLTPRRI